jgi:hypothetical protein
MFFMVQGCVLLYEFDFPEDVLEVHEMYHKKFSWIIRFQLVKYYIDSNQ